MRDVATGRHGPNEFGDIVALYRERLGLTQSELAELLPLLDRKHRISGWETGRYVPVNPHLIDQLALALNLPPGQLWSVAMESAYGRLPAWFPDTPDR